MGLFSLPGSDNKPKLYTDPFSKTSFKSSFIHIDRHYMDGRLTYDSKINFKKGDTEGTQKFSAPDLPTLLQKMEAFMNSLS